MVARGTAVVMTTHRARSGRGVPAMSSSWRAAKCATRVRSESDLGLEHRDCLADDPYAGDAPLFEIQLHLHPPGR